MERNLGSPGKSQRSTVHDLDRVSKLLLDLSSVICMRDEGEKEGLQYN